MENPIILILYWFESFCLVVMGGVLFGYFSPNNISIFVKIGIFNAISLYCIRNIFKIAGLPINLHMLITLTIFIIIIYKLGNVGWLISCLTGIIGYVVVIFNEMTLVYYYIQWFKIPVEKVATNIYLHLKMGLIADITYVFIIGIIFLFKYISNIKIGENV